MTFREIVFDHPIESKHVAAQSEEEASHEKWVADIHDRVIREYPELAQVNVSILFLHPENDKETMGAFYRTPTSQREPQINMDLGSQTHMEALKKNPKNVV